MSKRPVIGVIPLMDYQRQSYWMLPGYFGGIVKAGGFPVMLPLTSDIQQIEQALEICSGFLFTGGQDVSPSLYHEEKTVRCGECSSERDAMEHMLLKTPCSWISRSLEYAEAFSLSMQH